ncbi:PREDICTED: deoxyhypusine synthase-like [Prunus mume]|uniref:Deoxyhypusine synthase-like n=1 Tax=Prunus mume TaxID=102107 RepID=A0ABM1LHU3_PRUMU|nr:PREDICTED: deoxyhypusine synthase-like [Prunus mume]
MAKGSVLRWRRWQRDGFFNGSAMEVVVNVMGCVCKRRKFSMGWGWISDEVGFDFRWGVAEREGGFRWVNNITVFCPGLTDGSLGDMFYFHSFRSLGLIVDVVQDIRAMNGEAVHANPRKTGMIILGGGLPKHHICNANMMRNGADYAVFINTAPKFDGSDSGAHPDEAVSWGKIRGSAKTEVHCSATIAFPLLVAETFAKKAVKTMT